MQSSASLRELNSYGATEFAADVLDSRASTFAPFHFSLFLGRLRVPRAVASRRQLRSSAFAGVVEWCLVCFLRMSLQAPRNSLYQLKPLPATSARLPTLARAFYNRQRELKVLRERLELKPNRVHLLLGPVSTGKTGALHRDTTAVAAERRVAIIPRGFLE